MNSNTTTSKKKTNSRNPFIHHPWFVSIVPGLIFLLLGAGINNVKGQIATATENIRGIKETTDTLRKCLINEIKDGLAVKVGINNKEISGNGVIVFADNTYNLNEGDQIYLTNSLDDKYETTVKFLVQRTPRRNGDKSEAEMFISLEAAKRLDILSGRPKQGVYLLKMTRKQDKIRSINSANKV
ncbi:hypothetical protein SAMN02745119_02567 [Trichlorobacter thiogenes]|uniref:Uncharacterized protein n=1 Tax=Trichlorobacter thiogenes TaxID=115783 RepID=A0A1T4QWI0_9BACT|nr:hypothetical protein [Trichlorobacter thiogenes]SKA08025.1 hypothetical protein SAMN02745119_02567 [Trichlorobacter thiogenes]